MNFLVQTHEPTDQQRRAGTAAFQDIVIWDLSELPLASPANGSPHCGRH